MTQHQRPSIYDRELGWTNRPGYPGFGPLGNREHGRTGVAGLAPGSILALGDSFTFGSEVGPLDTWPAILEGLLARPVINGGIGGHGIDQMVLWGERLVKQLAPQMVVLSFIPADIDRCGMAVFSGAGKPYFTPDGELHNVPVPDRTRSARLFAVMERLGLRDSYDTVLSEAETVEVGCMLMCRLAAIGVPVVIVAQNGFSEFGFRSASRARQCAVLDAARAAGLLVVDTFETIKAAVAVDGADKFYVNGTGHMTAQGNGIIARLIAGRVAAMIEVAA